MRTVEVKIEYTNRNTGDTCLSDFGGACFAGIGHHVHQVIEERLNPQWEVSRVGYDLANSYSTNIPNMFSLPMTEVGQEILSDLFAMEKLDRFLACDWKESADNGVVWASGDWDGRYVVSVLSIFRQFQEYPYMQMSFPMFREAGATPDEAFILASRYYRSFSFTSGEYSIARSGFGGHAAIAMAVFTPPCYYHWMYGWRDDTPEDTFTQHPFYRGRDELVMDVDAPWYIDNRDSIYRELDRLRDPEEIVQAFRKWATEVVEEMVEERKEVVNG